MLLSVFILLKDYQKLKRDFTSVVYQLIVLLLLTLSLLIYSVRKYNGLINRYSFIVGFVQISSFYVDLPTDMTVYPQEYTLHCVKTGHYYYNFEMRLGGSTVTSASGCTDTLSSCSGRVLLQDYSNTYDHTVTISWDGQTITSGSFFSLSNTGDQTFQCNMWVNGQPRRLRNETIKGMYNNSTSFL